MSTTYPNLSAIVAATLRNRTEELVKNLTESNKFLEDMLSPWEPQELGSIALPDFIRLRAEGKAKMKNGWVYLLKE